MVEFNALSDEQRIERFGRLAKVALDRFGMPTATLKHRSYMENVLYEVSDETSGCHASLRICRSGWEGDALEREVCWLSELGRDTDLRIPIPIPTLEGEPFAVIECREIPDPRACVLFHWVDGSYAAPEGLTPARLRSVGQCLAKLHDHAETFRLPAELAIDRFDADALDRCDHRVRGQVRGQVLIFDVRLRVRCCIEWVNWELSGAECLGVPAELLGNVVRSSGDTVLNPLRGQMLY